MLRTDYHAEFDLKRHVVLKARSMFSVSHFEVSIGNTMHVTYRHQIVSITSYVQKSSPFSLFMCLPVKQRFLLSEIKMKKCGRQTLGSYDRAS